MKLSFPKNLFLRFKKSAGLSTLSVGFLVSIFFALFFNQQFFSAILVGREMNSIQDYLFMFSAFLLLVAFINLMVSLFAFRHLFKPWLILLVISASMALYFVNSYGVIIDKGMIQNIAETDFHEATELFNFKILGYLFILGIAPSILIARMPIHYASLPRELVNKGISFGISIILFGGVALTYYQDYASLFRNDRHMRDYVVPAGYAYSTFSYFNKLTATPPPALTQIGTDAKLGHAWLSKDKKVLSILVVGETARADNFSLNGYTRKTNASLEQEDIIYFDNASSCGTATAVSLPCMFSASNRNDYDDEAEIYRENLLDVINHAGLPVLWRDNNSGCKGVCDRVTNESLSNINDTTLCHNGECYDMVLMKQLEDKIADYQQGGVIVLHQKGSHGPAYSERVPKEEQRYTPFCNTNQLQQCTRSEIINAYDNTIAYTDLFLETVIQFLKKQDAEYDTSLVYVSDHGESLGEKGIYLHGIPYMIAPEQQTHIPFLVWISDHYSQRFQIDKSCMASKHAMPVSHDNLFSSMLGLLDIKTAVYNPSQDIFNSCKRDTIHLTQQTPKSATSKI